MIADFERNVGENDSSHLEEVLALHDLTRDKAAGSPEEFRQRCLQNVTNRAIHHHVFDTRSAVRLLDYARFEILRVDNFEPYHIIILARRKDATPNNSAFLTGGWAGLLKSPFPSDRARVR